MNSQAETELAQTIEKIKAVLKKMRELPAVSFGEGISIYDYVHVKNSALALRLKENSLAMENAKQAAIDNLSNCYFNKEFVSFEKNWKKP